MTRDARFRSLAATGCEVAFDNLTRQLYATDASIYQVVPQAVAFPRSAAQAAAVIRAAADAGLPVTPRGAGTGLVGGAIGDGLVVDFARHNRQLHGLNRDYPSVSVGAGVVLDQLNAFLNPHGLAFGPDVATSSRATLGGMIANNSSGARVPFYGVTADHVLSLEVVMADGTIAEFGTQPNGPPPLRRAMERLIATHAAEIARRFPPGLLKRWSGYGIDRFLHRRASLTELMAGSEGTLAGIWSAELKAVPLPREKGLGLIFFASVEAAMQATVELLALKPAAIEHVDRVLFDQTRGQLPFQAARDLLELDAQPCEALLIVEFYDDDVAGRLAALAARRLGLRSQLVTSATGMNLVWGLRKAGLSLLTGCAGPAKPVTGIEDTAVRPEQLPAYVAALRSLLHSAGVEACFYGHAAAGLLHVRPVLDLHRPEDRRKFRQITTEVSALVRQFQGSFAAEHGVGMARTEFMAEQVGPEMLGLMQEIKRAFDPRGVFNPGKIVGPAASLPHNGACGLRIPEFKLDTQLRVGSGAEVELPFEPVLAFAAKDGSFLANLEQCNGCGGCLKQTPTMCPTFLATGEEIMSPRGRANAIRAVLEGRGPAGGEVLRAAELEVALSQCLSCKACLSECPSNVNLALLKAELLNARWRRDGLGLRERMLSAVDRLGRLGSATPKLANAALEWPWLRRWVQQSLGISVRRPLPKYTSERFDFWFRDRAGLRVEQASGLSGPASRRADSAGGEAEATTARRSDPGGEAPGATPGATGGTPVPPGLSPRHARSEVPRRAPRGTVILWDDTFVRYHEPHIGKAAVKVLEAAGFEVNLPVGRQCCGRPAFSQGDLDAAGRLGRHNLALLTATEPGRPILFLEPSCWSMFVQDYAELKLPGAEAVGRRCWLFEEFIENLLAREPQALSFAAKAEPVAIHAHCHAKALRNPALLARLAQRLPGRRVQLLDTGCCGMAGAFGMMESNYELSLKVAAPLIQQLRAQPEGAVVVASGTSCRHQISDLAAARPRHMAEVLAAALPG